MSDSSFKSLDPAHVQSGWGDASTPDAELDLEVQRNIIRNFARQTPINATVTALAAGLTGIILWPEVPLPIVIAWVGLQVCTVAFLAFRWLRTL